MISIEEALQDIPRWLTAYAEWGAALVYILLAPKRLSRIPLVIAIAAGLPLLWAVQEIAGSLPLGLWSLGMVLAGAAMYGLIWLCVDTDAKGAGDLFARAFVLGELIASLEWQLDQHFFAGPEWTWQRTTLVGVVVVGSLSLAYLAERRNFKPGTRIAIDGRILASTLSIALVTFLMSNLSFISDSGPFSAREGREVFYVRTLVDLAGFIALYAMRSQRLQLQRAIEIQSMNTLLRTQHDQYLQSRQQMEAVNARYHDMKHYIQALRGEADEGARAQLADDLEESIRGYSVVALRTGNSVVDTMLASKVGQAELEGITVTCVVDGSAVDFLDVMDIVTVFGNALDNAIEATRKVEDPEQRLVRIAVYRQGDLALMRFENYFGGELRLIDGLPPTTKDEKHHHGYGLKNIREVAHKHHGTFTVHAEDGWFVLRILVPIPE